MILTGNTAGTIKKTAEMKIEVEKITAVAITGIMILIIRKSRKIKINSRHRFSHRRKRNQRKR